jgi:hypothetical protein
VTDTADGCPSIDTVKARQRELTITGHLAWTDRERFVLAHTDPERATGEPLHQCQVHRALACLSEYCGEIGYYEAATYNGDVLDSWW